MSDKENPVTPQPSQLPRQRLKIIHDKPIPGSPEATNLAAGPREKTFAELQNEKYRKEFPTFRSSGDPLLDNMELDRLSKLKQSIEFAHQVIVANSGVNRIKESMFVFEMLPFLFNEIPEFAKNRPDVQMTPAKWIAAAGGPHAEFDVIHDQSGEVLFRVPAFFTRDMYDNDAARSRGSLSDMFIRTKQLSHQSPIRAKAYSSREFTDRGVSNKRPDVITQTQERWNAIFKRYGRPLIDFDEKTNKQIIKTDKAGTSTSADGGSRSQASAEPIEYENNGFDF